MCAAPSSSPAFRHVTENIIKSIKQRQLARYWERLRGASALPSWPQVKPEDIAASREHLCVVDVVRDGGALRYRIREHGEKLAEYYGSACRGKHLDEITGAEALPALSAMYAQTVTSLRPVYTVAPVSDARNRPVTFERLLLPFASSSAGGAVDIVLASIEAISIEGAFDSHKILEISQRRPIAGFQGIIGTPPG